MNIILPTLLIIQIEALFLHLTTLKSISSIEQNLDLQNHTHKLCSAQKALSDSSCLLKLYDHKHSYQTPLAICYLLQKIEVKTFHYLGKKVLTCPHGSI